MNAVFFYPAISLITEITVITDNAFREAGKMQGTCHELS